METGHIDIKIDTSRVDGQKEVEVPVTFRGQDPKTKQPFYSTAELEVRAVSRRTSRSTPASSSSGPCRQDKAASRRSTVTYTGPQPDWKITEVGAGRTCSTSPYEPLAVRAGRAYRVTLTLKQTPPPGI